VFHLNGTLLLVKKLPAFLARIVSLGTGNIVRILALTLTHTFKQDEFRTLSIASTTTMGENQSSASTCGGRPMVEVIIAIGVVFQC
jgi:hypothetical protein